MALVTWRGSVSIQMWFKYGTGVIRAKAGDRGHTGDCWNIRKWVITPGSLLIVCVFYLCLICVPFHFPTALKRSFDIDDVDEIPTFSPTSSVTSPISPSSLLNKNNEVRSPVGLVSPTYRSRISLNSSPAQSPAMKNRMVSSLSFNRGTTGKPTINANVGINRASSFQNRYNPNGFNLSSGPGSDNESLHSSSSSLEYQASSRLNSYISPPQSPVGTGEYKAQPQRLGSHALKKFSSHGNVFHSEQDSHIVIPTDPLNVSHGSMPSLDLQLAESGGIRRLASPGSRVPNPSLAWNAHRFQNNGSSGKEAPIKHQLPKTKELPRLNKFPLDLENLGVKPQTETRLAPRPPPRFSPLSTSPTVSESPSASVSSLDSTDLPTGHGYGMEKPEQDPCPGAIPVPDVSDSPVLLSPAQTPRFNLVSQPQVVQIAPVAIPPGLRGDGGISTARIESQTKDSVGSILQRIASFSRAEVKTPASSPRSVMAMSNGIKKEPLPVQSKEVQRSEGTFILTNILMCVEQREQDDNREREPQIKAGLGLSRNQTGHSVPAIEHTEQNKTYKGLN